jgi:hypothetical protein
MRSLSISSTPNILSCAWSVTVKELRIGDRIHWTLWYSVWLYCTIHYWTHTSVHSHVFTGRCSLAASKGRRSASSWFQNYLQPQLLDSHSNSSQLLNLSNYPSNSLTHQPTNINQLNSTQLNSTDSHCLTSRHGSQKTLFLCSSLMAVA